MDAFFDFLGKLVNWIAGIPNEYWGAIGAAIGISGILQGLKNLLSLQSEKLITFLLMVLSFAAPAIDYLNSAVAQNPGVLGRNTAALVGLSTIMYRYLVKPTTSLLTDAHELRLQRDNKSVPAVPAESLLPPSNVSNI